jgi:hypothetical protein
VSAVAASLGKGNRYDAFDAVRALARAHAGLSPAGPSPRGTALVAHMTEPWYCCAEPGPEQMV